MYYYYFKRLFPEDVLVYIEEYDKVNKQVILDFIDDGEYQAFVSLIKQSKNNKNASMMVLRDYQQRNVQENTIYAIKRDVINEWVEDGSLVVSNGETSLLIGYTVNLKKDIPVFNLSISLGGYEGVTFDFSEPQNHQIENLDLAFKGKIEVVVRDVGQGSWNEITNDGSVKIVYDIGCSVKANANDVRKLVNKKLPLYIKSKPGLIISHWDKDHYHCLLGMSDEELSLFSYVICRAYTPNNTSQRLLEKLIRNIGRDNVYTFAHMAPVAGPVRLCLVNSPNNQLLIFNGQYNKNRNISGIILALRTSSSSVVFSADTRYDQLSKDVLPFLNYKNYHYLIVPHHGGHAGPYLYEMFHSTLIHTAVISVGENTYRHPLDYYLNSLRTEWPRIKETRFEGDISLTLI